MTKSDQAVTKMEIIVYL